MENSRENHEYLFIIMQYGEEIYRRTFTDYDKARDFFYLEYYNDDQAILTYIDGKELRFDKAYVYFDLLRYANNYFYGSKKST